MGTVVDFRQAKNENDAVRTKARAQVAARFVRALLWTPFLWLGQLGLGLLAIVAPIARTLGKLAIAFMIFATLIEWADQWKHMALLEIPAGLIALFVTLHVTSSTVLRRFGCDPS